LSPDLERFGGGTALLDHLFNEGLKRGVTKFVVRVPVDDPIADLFKARGFTAYATEHALLAENVASRAAAPLAGWRAMRREDELGLYLLYCASTPKAVAAVEAANFSEWRRTFGLGARAGLVQLAPLRPGRHSLVTARGFRGDRLPDAAGARAADEGSRENPGKNQGQAAGAAVWLSQSTN